MTGIALAPYSWAYEETGRTVATQVQRGDCGVILNLNVERAGSSRLFVSLEADALAALERDLAARSVSVSRGWWGLPVIAVTDPRGNELLFPVEEGA